MLQFFSKIAKICLWVLVPTLFISGVRIEPLRTLAAPVDGDYTLQVTGNLNKSFSGSIAFENSY